MAKKNRNDTLDWLAYLPIRALVSLTGIMPYRLRLATSGAIGQGIVLSSSRFRERVRLNLGHVFPDMTEDRKRQIMRETGDTFGRTFMEILHMKKFRAHNAIVPPSGSAAEALLEAAGSGKGAVIVSGHFGNWEGCRLWLMQNGFECAGVYRPTPNPYIDRIYGSGLEDNGKPMFKKGPRGMRGLVSHLAKGNIVALLVDQYDDRAEPLDFVGQPAPTSLFAPQLALKYGVPLIPMFSHRLDDGERVQVEVDPPIPHTDAKQMMQAVNDALAARIRARPGQYYWLHRRWSKTLGAPKTQEPEAA
ncbi:MAG: lysophospholipid acyltransferase family protein [Pseudomonadota bacterium]